MSNELAKRVEDLQLLGWSEEGAKLYFSDDLIHDNYLEMVLAKPELALGLIALILLGFVCLVSVFNHVSTRNKDQEISINKTPLTKQEKQIKEKILVKQNLGAAKDSLGTPKDSLGAVKQNLGAVKQNLGAVKQNLGATKDNLGAVKDNLGLTRELIFIFGKNILSRFDNNKQREPFFEYFKKLFIKTSVDTDVLIIHVLLISLIIYESINNVFVFLVKEFPTLKTISIKYLFQYPEAFKSSRSEISKTSLLEDRKKILMNKTNSELKNLLKGVANISRLKKVQLVEKILYLELDL